VGGRVTPGDFSWLIVRSIASDRLINSAQPQAFTMANGSPPFRRLAAGLKTSRHLRNVRPAKALIAGPARVSEKQKTWMRVAGSD
jgi:hypothetical protein